MEKSEKIRILVVDDSLFMRALVSDMLNSDPEIEVIDTAKDGAEALKKIPQKRPDCITLDLVMPGWNGLTTLNHIMAEYPTPVVILSAHSKEGADITIKCLDAGAVGFVLKPSGELSLDIKKIKTQLLDEVKAASKVSIGKIKIPVAEKLTMPKRKILLKRKIVVIGASTGGPQTLESILPSLPYDFPAPIIIAQHMPSSFFSESLAEHLNEICELKVKVPENNEVIQAGTVYLAPGGFHTTLKLRRTKEDGRGMRDEASIVLVSVANDHPSSIALSPSIDMTMKSVAEFFNGNAIGIILSGMGDDGREGMRAIKESGGSTIAQDKSSLIYGMPKVVIDDGYADKTLPASEIAGEIIGIVER